MRKASTLLDLKRKSPIRRAAVDSVSVSHIGGEVREKKKVHGFTMG